MGPFIFFWGEDASLPDSLRLLKPSAGKITADEFQLEFGGTFLHFGVRAFRPGLTGSGTKRLADGFWFYAEDEKGSCTLSDRLTMRWSERRAVPRPHSR
jgi:hypothetical protein